MAFRHCQAVGIVSIAGWNGKSSVVSGSRKSIMSRKSDETTHERHLKLFGVRRNWS